MNEKNKGLDTTSYILGKKAGGGPAPTPTYQDKEITITQNGEQTITADSGYDALRKVEITTNVPQPSGKITITQNGTDIDVSSYATADVSVPAGADLSEYFNSTIGSTASNNYPGWQKLIKKLPTNITPSGTNMSYAFVKFFGYADDNISLPNMDVSNVTNFRQCFYGNNSKQMDLDLSGWTFGSNITSFEEMFGNGYFININLSSIGIISSNNLTLSSMFSSCTKAKKINLSNLIYTGSGTVNTSNMFTACKVLEELDMSNFDFSKIGTKTNMFGNPQYTTNIPYNCLILVKDQTAKDWMTTNFSNYTNVQIKSEYIANQGA